MERVCLKSIQKKSFLQCSYFLVFTWNWLISIWSVYLHLPSVCSRIFFKTWTNYKTTCKNPNLVVEHLFTSDRTWPVEPVYLGHGRNWFFSAWNMCLWAYFEGEKKKKNFMKLVHWAFIICSFPANGKTPTGPLSSHITHKNTYICTGSCHTVSGVCQRFASAQTSQVFEQTGSFRFSVVWRQ